MSNNIFIDLTGEIVNKGWSLDWEFNEGVDLYKYNDCVSYSDCRTINPDVDTDVDGNGAWVYSLDNLETGGVYDEETNGGKGLFMPDISTVNNSLVSFNVDLPNLTDGTYMFGGCTRLTSWNIPLPNLTIAWLMFGACTGLTSFSGDLPNLTDGYFMFGACTRLTSFSGDLSKLTHGLYMFGSDISTCTKLDLASVKNIAENINDLTKDPSYGTGSWLGKELTIGIQAALQDTADLETALAAIRAKGWWVVEMYA